ncbi:hypothetical protein GGX14DRAFT_393704 [Mycena pura]|uniref:Uncharacterized protein n=1 Tax=Mycena pura TaxID=153505 RepID=A0AAD6VHB2_9AGAR|nr:hypothetical protein GGX14DRAFT_393704 [Mycena pura]
MMLVWRAPQLGFSFKLRKEAVGRGRCSSQKGSGAEAPYTLDNGMANDLEVEGSCKGQPVLPGLWEIPMYAMFDDHGTALTGRRKRRIESQRCDTATLENTFTAHYSANFGLYTHSIRLRTTYSGELDRKRPRCARARAATRPSAGQVSATGCKGASVKNGRSESDSRPASFGGFALECITWSSCEMALGSTIQARICSFEMIHTVASQHGLYTRQERKPTAAPVPSQGTG